MRTARRAALVVVRHRQIALFRLYSILRGFARYHNNFEVVKAKIEEVEARDHVRNFQPPVSGEEIMRIFTLKPCREVGQIKEAIKEAILDGSIPNEYEAAYNFMITKAKSMGLTEK